MRSLFFNKRVRRLAQQNGNLPPHKHGHFITNHFHFPPSFGRDVGYIETNKTGELYHKYDSPCLATGTVAFKYLRIRLTLNK